MRVRIPRHKPRTEMSLTEHLAELRRRLIVAVVTVAVAAVAGYFIYPWLLALLMRPLCQVSGSGGCSLYVTGPFDGFSTRLKVGGVFGLFAASPIVLWQLWGFVSPGLERRERRISALLSLPAALLFVSGAVVAYLVFPFALRFLQGAAGARVHAIYTPQSYLFFLLLLMVIFGVAFLFPVVLTGLELLGVVTPEQLVKRRRVAWFGIILAVAIFIPTNDPYSLTALTVPLVLFYEASIVVGRLARRRLSAA